MSQRQAIKENVDRIVISPNSRIPEIKHYIVNACLKQGRQNSYFIWEVHVYKEVLTLGKEISRDTHPVVSSHSNISTLLLHFQLERSKRFRKYKLYKIKEIIASNKMIIMESSVCT